MSSIETHKHFDETEAGDASRDKLWELAVLILLHVEKHDLRLVDEISWLT